MSLYLSPPSARFSLPPPLTLDPSPPAPIFLPSSVLHRQDRRDLQAPRSILRNSGSSTQKYGCLRDPDEIDGFFFLYNDGEVWRHVFVTIDFSSPFAIQLQRRTRDPAPSKSSRPHEHWRRKLAANQIPGGRGWSVAIASMGERDKVN
ncbi:hypothetical protein TIFTF001_012743 [Ficus carica]|uniref:Uncharacterized protein n=1 Tax=Ficus carica TaxID=3494 RepID=A0AA87ZZJ0_FICCA|nr:hypothetical protein TIFTF001_012743 [Ficus carica]